jgi:exodeoxyribonuclease V beta subunit
MAERLFAACGTWQRLARLPDGERRITDLRHVVEVAHGQQAAAHLTPAALVRWLERRGDDGSDGRERALRLEGDAEAVQILTVHHAKGLEYPVVFCPWLWKPPKRKRDDLVLCHDDDGRQVFDVGSPRIEVRRQQAQREDLEEDVRLAYVALTRARLRCYVLWGACARGHAHLGTGLGWLTRDPAHDAAAWLAVCADSDQAKQIDALGRIRTLIASHATVMSQSEPPVAVPDRWQDDAPRTAVWQARELSHAQRDQLTPWTVASYSSLVRTRRDDDDELALPVVDLAVPEDLTQGLVNVAQGADAGICLHAILEEWDCQPVVDPVMVERHLDRHGLGRSSPRHAAGCDAVAAIQELCARLAVTRLPGADFSLADTDPQGRRSEWEFNLPLIGLSPAAVAEDLAATDAATHARCGAALRTLGDRPVRGFLTGVVDLVWHHGGRWHVADWKSNHLGRRSAAYHREALWRPMVEGHYILQALCYVLALHRHLRARLADYDYDRHMGTTWYVFLRGIDGDPGHGFFDYRPPRALIERLEARLIPIVLEAGA